MWIYFLKRLLQMIPVMLIVTFLVYALMLAIPGDPARAVSYTHLRAHET